MLTVRSPPIHQEQSESEMNKTKISLVAILAIILLVSFGAIRVATNQLTVQAQETESTQKQKEHSKLYKEYKRDQKLPVLAATATDDVTIIEGVGQKVFQPDAPRHNFQTLINGLACNSDAVVIGVVKNKISQLTENEEFIFTDYELLVEDVLKDNPAVPIQKNTSIIITRPGGTIQINNRKVSALDETFKPLDVEGRYLLFLRFIPVTGAYKASSSTGSYQLKNNKTIKLTEESLTPELETGNDVGAFITDIRHAITGVCNN
jgi:hypothetical protein